MTADIRVTFVIPKDCKDENECSEEMQLAFTSCLQHRGGGIQAKFAHETEITEFDSLTKKDVYVLTEFEGELFESLKSAKCLVVGPRCLSCCLTEGISIPSIHEPVFTIGMTGLVVTASGLTKEIKESIKKKVQWMGGVYSTLLKADTTHLVSDTVLSDKYFKSVAQGIPIMNKEWVEAVWEASLTLNINGSSPDFDSYRLPPFANLQVTCTGLSRKDKQNIMKLINENGGEFSGAFQSHTTDVIVLTKEGLNGGKHKAAVEYGKPCVLPAWVIDSAKAGVSLPFSKYVVSGASTSSPIAERPLPDMSLNFSRITNLRPPCNLVDETKTSDISTMSGKSTKLSQDSTRNIDPFEKKIHDAFENFDMSTIKKAGLIFDGFGIYICGLEGMCRERATACVSRAGGVWYEEVHERVTHAACGTRLCAAAARRLLPPAVPVLSADWIPRSVQAGHALDEAQFSILEFTPTTPSKQDANRPRVEAASPMSKRNLQLLRRELLVLPPPTSDVDPEPPQNDILNHYLSQNKPEKENEPPVDVSKKANLTQDRSDVTEDLTDLSEPSQEIVQIFKGLRIEVQGLDEESTCNLNAEMSAAGGVLLAAGAGGDHVLVPLDFDPEDCITANAEPVTAFWVKDCLLKQQLIPIQYYHRPVKIPEWEGGKPPLEGVVACLSTYTLVERSFLDELANLLGANTQLRFCRYDTADCRASTHLICPTACGAKYNGAIKWGLPAVTAEWLLRCATEGKRVYEGPYLVGDTKAPSREEQNQTQHEEQLDEQMRTDAETTKEDILPPPGIGALNVEYGQNTDDADMSPASRYIAMARLGLLGGTQETPKAVDKEAVKLAGAVATPSPLEELSSPNLCAFSTRTQRRLRAVRQGQMPSDPILTPQDPFAKKIETPDSGFGAALRPGQSRLTPDARKRLWSAVHPLSHDAAPLNKPDTPLPKVIERALMQFGSEEVNTPPAPQPHGPPRKLTLQDQVDTPPAKMPKLTKDYSRCATPSSLNGSSASRTLAQLHELSAGIDVLVNSSRPRPKKSIASTADSEPVVQESQPQTVQWVDTNPNSSLSEQPLGAPKRFMLSSNVDNHEEIIEMIEQLGGQVSVGSEIDGEATHYLCAAPGRSEKMLGSIAKGLWVLHPAYVARSRAAERFLQEEEFEWGNPYASSVSTTLGGSESVLASAAYRWRAARSQAGDSFAGPFAGMRALLHVPEPRRTMLTRLLRAGGGQAIDQEPPYTVVDVTICFADTRRMPLSERDAAYLVSKRVPICAPVLLSAFLTDETPPDPTLNCLPNYRLD